MIPVKICGICCLEDALCASQCGAAAVGFIFYPPSVRYIGPRDAVRIINKLPKTLVRVGVFVNEEIILVRKIFEECGLDMLQFHGDETPGYCAHFPEKHVVKALELKTEDDLQKAGRYGVAAILADSRSDGLYGGTGKTSNWNLAGKVTQPLVLSGGLNENNVLEALFKVRPAALDINSGVESAPGRKDPEKIKRMMQIIQNHDSGVQTPHVFQRRG